MKGGFVKVEGMRIHHVHGGAGASSVLFVHGLGSAGYLEWRLNLPVIARSHRVFAPDLPGFGRSEKPQDGYGIPMFARVVEGYMDRQDLHPVLVGVSMGGRVALEVALRRPERVRKLVLVNALGLARPRMQLPYSVLLVPRLGEAALRLTGGMLRRLSPGAIRLIAERLRVSPDVAQFLDDSYLSGLREMHDDEGYVRAYAATVRALSSPVALLRSDQLIERLAATGLPVLLVWGAEDRLLPLAGAVRAHDRLPNSQLVVLDRAGHSPQVEQADEFNRALEDFLAH